MVMRSVNPATDEVVQTFTPWGQDQLEAALEAAGAARAPWAAKAVEERCRLVRGIAQGLRDRRESLARVITEEMGKLYREALGEVDKCAWVLEYYAEHGPAFLAAEPIDSDAGSSYVAYQPLGTVLAVMPWNFPFWQVFRFAAPALVAGNTALLKHASNVPRCALAIESVIRDAGVPPGVFQTLMITAAHVQGVIEDPRVHAVTLTGSEPAGRKVAASAGASLKKSVMELGGSDPFVVLEDADLEAAVNAAVASRFLNAGQSCIAAKRFIVVESVYTAFLSRFKEKVGVLHPGDPMDEHTTLAPMARLDLLEDLHHQVTDSIAAGATAITGCQPLEGRGCFYAPSILSGVEPGMRAYDEELFGPVAIVIHARDEADALRIANDTEFGLGASVWSADSARAERFALAVEAGCCFVNGMVKSDPRLPFGGIKNSGYGRELSLLGIREFVNAKTVWVA